MSAERVSALLLMLPHEPYEFTLYNIGYSDSMIYEARRMEIYCGIDCIKLANRRWTIGNRYKTYTWTIVNIYGLVIAHFSATP